MTKSIVVICTHSSMQSFKFGNSYVISDEGITTERSGDVAIGFGIDTVSGTEYKIEALHGFATFSSAEAGKEKSLLKMLVRAHVNYAKSRCWGDSKIGGNKSWNRSGYKSSKDWARCFALGYDLKAIKEDALAEGQPIDQDFVNWYVEDQMSYF